MYIRPLIFDRDVVGSKQITERVMCAFLHVYDRKKSDYYIGDKVEEEEESNLKIYDVTSKLLMFDPDVGGIKQMRRLNL